MLSLAASMDKTKFSVTLSAQLDNTYGAYLLGTFFGILLYGVLLYQARDYYRLYPTDRVVLKVLVAAMVAMQTIFCILNINTCYHYLVANYSAPKALSSGVWSLNLSPFFVTAILDIAQSFFTRRAFLVGRRYRPVVLFVIFLLVAGLVLATYATAQCFAFNRAFEANLEQVMWFNIAGSIIASVADLLLTAVLILALRQSRTGFKSTDSMISVISMYTINTGLLTGVFHVTQWVLSIKYPSTLIYAFVGIVNAGLYGNVLLSTLNARIWFAKREMYTFGAETDFIEQSSIEFHGRQRQSTVGSASAPRDGIELKPQWSMPQTPSVVGGASSKGDAGLVLS